MESDKLDSILFQTSYNETLKEELEKFKEEFSGIRTENYENGKSVSRKKVIFPRKNYRLEEIRSTVLIPEKYLEHFKKRVIECQGVRGYVNYLLSKYRIHISNGIIPAYANLTTKYQEKNQNLQKVSFRPLAEDWAELKLYRISFGMSISAFLVYLLIADSVDFARTVLNLLVAVGVPTIWQLNLTAKVYLCNKRAYYSVVFQFRADVYH